MHYIIQWLGDDAPVQCAEKWNKALDKYDPPNSAVVWIVWLIGQLTVSVLLLTLSGFHFGLQLKLIISNAVCMAAALLNFFTRKLNI